MDSPIIKQEKVDGINYALFRKFLVVVSVFVLGYLAGYGINIGEGGRQNVLASSFIGNSVTESLSDSQLNFLYEIQEKLSSNYFGEELPSSDDIRIGAAKGIVESFGDKYNYYYSQEEWNEIQSDNAGKFEGIGVKLLHRNESVVIETAIVGSPALKSGVMAGDIILEVDSKTIEGLELSEVAKLIRGESGTEVKINIYRPKSKEELEFKVKRAEIDTPSIELKKLKNNGYRLIVSKFTESDLSELKSQWYSAVSEIDEGGASYVVLDLRDNSGGWVDAARYVAEEFLTEGKVILKEVSKDGSKIEVKTLRDGRLRDIPLIILVNGGSASSSEIVAGALQDHGRAKLIGKSTVGKGVEQSVLDTSDGGKLFVVSKKWFTPNGRNLSNSDALKPDIEVDLSTDDFNKGLDPQLERAIREIN